MIRYTISFVVFGLLNLCSAAPADEKVDELPDMAKFDKYSMYSGYIPIEKTTKNIHYLFIESQSQTQATDPVVLWTNGGPGCSSMLGFAQEHGPWQLADGATEWAPNNYSWNREANMLYIEQPAGVGYSYCNNATNPEDCTHTDASDAADNLAVVLGFFEKFPEYKTNDLYLSGESYAGIYIPLLADAIHEHNQAASNDVFKPNLKGFMVGNGVTNYRYDTDPAYIEMGYYHSLYSQETRDSMTFHACNYSMIYFDEYYDKLSPDCKTLLNTFNTVTADVNVYDIFGYCWGLNDYTQNNSFNLFHSDNLHALTVIGGVPKPYKKYFTAKEYTPWVGKYRNDQVEEVPPCIYGAPVLKYFNRKDVRAALHITNDQAWDLCSGLISYTSDEKGSQYVYEKLIGQYKILKFSGDTDGAVPTAGTLAWINDLNLKVVKEWQPYFSMKEGVKQLAGYMEEYEGNFLFGSVHGAGHMAPQFKPAETYHLVFNWLKGTPI